MKYLAIVLLVGVFLASAAATDYTFARDRVARVQDDLLRAADFARQGAIIKERNQIDRYGEAQRTLSKFDEELSKGKFDKDKLDKAIDELKKVVEHNTLSSQDRDALTNDLRELRLLRAARGLPY